MRTHDEDDIVILTRSCNLHPQVPVLLDCTKHMQMINCVSPAAAQSWTYRRSHVRTVLSKAPAAKMSLATERQLIAPLLPELLGAAT